VDSDGLNLYQSAPVFVASVQEKIDKIMPANGTMGIFITCELKKSASAG
jgi:hypothetical protein